MDIGSIFLILALLLLVGLFISRPLLEKQTGLSPQIPNQQEHQVSTLLAERDRIINSLQELDFDFTLGKIPEEDYPAQRTLLLQRGSDILRQLDEFHPEPAPQSTEERLEAAIAARRAARLAVPAAVPQGGNGSQEADDDVEVLIAARRRARPEKAVGFCPRCGGPVQKSDRFCPKCGAVIS